MGHCRNLENHMVSVVFFIGRVGRQCRGLTMQMWFQCRGCMPTYPHLHKTDPALCCGGGISGIVVPIEPG